MSTTEIRSDELLGEFGDRERRRFPIRLEEVRDSGAGEGQFTVSGYAAVYNRLSLDLGGFKERILPGAFDRVLNESPKVLLTWDHDSRYTLANTKNSTLELTADPGGLRFWARIAPTSYANDLRLLMERGDVDEASFVFNVDSAGQEWRTSDNGDVERDISSVTGLYDVCVTSAAAYPDSSSKLLRARALLYAHNEGFIPVAPPVEAGETSPRKGDVSSRKRLLALRAQSRSAVTSHRIKRSSR